MVKPENKKYVGWMLAGFGTISMSVLFFFFLYRLQGVGEALDKVMGILMPFVYGGILAYLLRPMCNWYSEGFRQLVKGKHNRLAEGMAITCSIGCVVAQPDSTYVSLYSQADRALYQAKTEGRNRVVVAAGESA